MLSLLLTSTGKLVAPRSTALMSGSARRVIDSHLHVWSDGTQFPWVVEPPDALKSEATFEKLLQSAREAGVTGALIVQPANHKYDHSYVTSALRSEPAFFRGMCLANPTLPAAEAVETLKGLHSDGYVGVRFNPYLFPDGMDSEVGRAMYKAAGEMGMPVGVMAFGGFPAQLPAIKSLLAHAPSTKLIIDHMAFFRQPATGGLLGDAATNDDAAWDELLSLGTFPQVYVKVSALFRTSAELPPHLDLQPRLAQLLKAYGAHRLMWGSDFPFVLLGGQTTTDAALTYEQAAQVPSFWTVDGLDAAARDALMGGTAASLFGFGSPPDAKEL